MREACLDRLLADLGAHVDEATRTALCLWIEGIVEWNGRIDLTAARSDEELLDLMVADAAVLSRHVPSGVRFVDVGSGCGGPGLALAILRPDLRATLVEPLDKRVAFLRRTVGTLAWPQGERPAVVRGRSQTLPAQAGFDVALSRATFAPEEWLDEGARLAPKGDVWVLLAQGEAPSKQGSRAEEETLYVWPLTGFSRRAVRYKAT